MIVLALKILAIWLALAIVACVPIGKLLRHISDSYQPVENDEDS